MGSSPIIGIMDASGEIQCASSNASVRYKIKSAFPLPYGTHWSYWCKCPCSRTGICNVLKTHDLWVQIPPWTPATLYTICWQFGKTSTIDAELAQEGEHLKVEDAGSSPAFCKPQTVGFKKSVNPALHYWSCRVSTKDKSLIRRAKQRKWVRSAMFVRYCLL